MKIRIEFDENIKEDEVIIRCRELTSEVKNVQVVLSNILSEKAQITFFKDNTEYYISLEEILPSEFVRASKSTIVNINNIYSMTRNLSSSSLVEFQNTHKKIYVSRHYYKSLKDKLIEKRR